MSEQTEPEQFTLASADRCRDHPQHVMVDLGYSQSLMAHVLACSCGKRVYDRTDESKSRGER